MVWTRSQRVWLGVGPESGRFVSNRLGSGYHSCEVRRARPKKPLRKRRDESVLLRLGLAAALFVLGMSACELLKPNQPKASCSSDADCESNGRGDRFCIQGHCVQCLTSESCGGENVCSEGICYTRCKKATDCPEGRPCEDGFCTLPVRTP